MSSELQGWHAQQIASGEAEENANFQPLGGDWCVSWRQFSVLGAWLTLYHGLILFASHHRRERVKRKRAQVNKEAASTTEESIKGNQQPALAEFSRDLPSGWQVI